MPSSTHLLVRGIVAILFGIVAITWPGITLAALVLLFGVYAIIDGVVNLILAFAGPRRESPWVHVLIGIVGIAAGVIAFTMPGITLFALVMFIAAWAIVTGVLEFIAGIRWRRVIDNEWMLMLSGALAVLFGVLIIAWPAAGAVSIALVLGFFAIVEGILRIAAWNRFRKLAITPTL